MKWVLELARDNGCRLVLAGDTREHHGVKRGDALRSLEQSGAVSQAILDKNYRQRNPKLRAAIDDIAKGKGCQGFEQWDGLGVVREFKDPAERRERLVQAH